MSTLRGFLDIRPSERRNTFAAFATLLSLTTGHTLLETARDALFLAKIPASQLPWMYLAIVVFALGLSQLRRRDGQIQTKRGVALALVMAGGVTAVFWLLASSQTKVLLYALYIWTGLFASWATVQFWTLLGRIHTISQAKRLYGIIGGGAVLGAVAGAVLARAAMVIHSPRSLVLLAAVIFAVSALPCVLVSSPPMTPETTYGDEAAPRAVSTGLTLLWQNQFARRVLGIVLLATVTVTLGDFLFKSLVASQIKDARELAEYFSSFYAVTNALALITQVVVAPWVFRSLGVQRALLFFPILMVIAAGSVVATGGLLLTAVTLKGLDATLRYSVHRTSMELLLVPVPDGTRERIKPIVDLVGSRGGQAIASLGVLFLVAVGAGDPVTVGAVVLTLAVVWAAVVVTIRRLYLDVFRETLKAGGLTGKAELPELDLGALETLFAGLNSSRDMEVLASLELLAEQHRERLIPALLLYHPSRDVVLRTLEIFTQMGRRDFLPIADRLNSHPEREVAAAALRARTAVAPDRALLVERLADPCAQVAVTALVALMARGWIDLAEADERIEAALASQSWQTAAELARAIRDIAAEGTSHDEGRFDRLLMRLTEASRDLHDVSCGVPEATPPPGPPRLPAPAAAPADVRVLLELARAMGVRKNPQFLPYLAGMLSRHELRAEARAAIQAIPNALPALDEAMGLVNLPRDVRIHLPRTISLFEPLAASRVLLRHLAIEKDGTVRFKILRGLVKLRRATPDLAIEDGVLTPVVESTIDHARTLRKWGRALSETGDEAPTSSPSLDPLRAAHHLLVDLVRDKEVHTVERIFLLLELIYREDFEAIRRGLRSKNPKTRASSLELAENLVKPPLRARILALVGDGAPESGGDEVVLSYEEALVDMVKNGGRTMRTLAEYRANELGLHVGVATSRSDLHPNALESTIGKRILDKARDLFVPETPGGTRAPA